ncbi:unnamed protein product [Ilex paraguariensis]|uniref:Uncharacterized protein n=1 Tax=Ilex paraguariensis TaxID=185542 RepID=A0ABC8QZ29_9AQUA
MEGEKYGGHVLVLPYPGQGHINPLLQFAKRLASKGVKATLATTHYTVKSICAPKVGVESISDGFDQGGFAQARNEDVYLKSFRENGSRTLSELIQKYKNSSSPVNCVVYDSFLPWALDVAKQNSIFGAAFFTNSATVCAIFCRIHHGLLSLPVKIEDTPMMIPGLPPLNFPDLPSFLKAPESYPAYLKMKLSQFSNLDQADWIFGNTFETLESEAVESVSELWPGELIGPMVPSAYLDDRIDGDKGYGAIQRVTYHRSPSPWALDVAKQNSIFGAAFFTNSATVCAIFCRIHHGFLSLPVKIEDTPMMIPGLPPLNFPDLPSFLKAPESYPAYLKMKLSQFSNLDQADWIFGNTFETLEGEAVESVSELWPGELIGPMVPSAYLDDRIDGDKGYGASINFHS